MRDSPYELVRGLLNRRAEGDTTPISYWEAKALQIVRDRGLRLDQIDDLALVVGAMPRAEFERWGFKVQLSPYMQSVLGVSGENV